MLEIRLGLLRIRPASGMDVPGEWLSMNESRLVSEISAITGVPMFLVVSHSVGNYGKGRYPGLHLRLLEAGGCQDHYTIFNVITTRSRNTKHGKAGSPLPPGHFAVPKGSAFYNLWLKAGLPKPPRLSSFHDYVGKMNGLLFTGEVGIGNRLVTKSLSPTDVTSAAIIEACRAIQPGRATPDNKPSSSGQIPDRYRTIVPDKHIDRSQESLGVQRVFNTCQKRHDEGKQEEREQEGNTYIVASYTCPTDQSEEEWLAEYENAPSL